jgi:hypothetical protein
MGMDNGQMMEKIVTMAECGAIGMGMYLSHGRPQAASFFGLVGLAWAIHKVFGK